MREFSKGQRIKTATGGTISVIEKLGEGGQGVVYKVKYLGKEYALKWYTCTLEDPKAFYRNTQDNIKKGAPTEAFLWPFELTEHYHNSFGYIMPLRKGEYKEFSRFLKVKERFGSLKAVVNAALCIVNGFRALHRRGYSYQDLNDGNFFIDPVTGDVLICDNDNVAPYGTNMGVVGKCRYMAPEVVLGKKRPDSHTDRFSLAVALFLLLFMNHPLEGARVSAIDCLEGEEELRVYGREPVFIFDKHNESNRPDRKKHKNAVMLWPVYPEFVRRLFQRAFSHEAMVGRDIEQRVRETEWQKCFITLRGVTVPCPRCGSETFIDPSASASRCINCGKGINRPLMLKVEKYYAAMLPGTKLYTAHMDMDSDEFRGEKAEVVASRKYAGVYGLKNRSGMIWEATLPGGSSKTFGEGEVVRLVKGMKINFGKNTAIIE